MEGQMSIFDFMPEPDPEPKEIGKKCEGCKYKIFLHINGNAKQSCEYADGCKYTFRGWSYERDGKLYEAPRWMREERCETCKYWEILPISEQPPEGWGVKGQCNYSHEPEMMKNGYWITDKNSYCDDFRMKGAI